MKRFWPGFWAFCPQHEHRDHHQADEGVAQAEDVGLLEAEGDAALDSAVLIDNFRFDTTPIDTPTTNPAPSPEPTATPSCVP